MPLQQMASTLLTINASHLCVCACARACMCVYIFQTGQDVGSLSHLALANSHMLEVDNMSYLSTPARPAHTLWSCKAEFINFS